MSDGNTMVTQGVLYIAMGDYINKMILSENRATILSFFSMVFSFFMIIIFLLIGFIGDMYSLNTSLRYLDGLGVVIVLVNSYILLVKMDSVKKE